MKFGKYLASRQLELPDYSEHFIDYKALKKLIKKLADPSKDDAQNGAKKLSTPTEIQFALRENKAAFFFRVERELDKVNSYYLEKQANFAVTLDLMLIKRNEHFSKSQVLIQRIEDNSAGETSDQYFRNSITYLNLYQNFKNLHQDLLRFQQFVELNETGFMKVVKKWDKRSRSQTKELFIQTAVSVQPIFHKDEINQLSDLVSLSLFELSSVLEGDYSPIINFPSHQFRRGDINEGVFNSRRSHLPRTKYAVNVSNEEIDELYNSFLNFANVNETDSELISRWLNKLKVSSKQKNPNGSDNPKRTNDSYIFKLTSILSLAVKNMKITDTFLETFLKLANFALDVTLVRSGFNNNKNLLHECCCIPPVSLQENTSIVNNGVKVTSSNETTRHSRTFIVKYIIDHTPKDTLTEVLTHRDYLGRTCLHYAAQLDRLDLIELFSDYFPRDHVDDLDNESMSAILLAIKHCHIGIVKKLVGMGSKINPRSDETTLQYLPINYACKIGDYEILDYLLYFSQPDIELINQQDVEGLAPLHVVSRSGNHRLIRLLVDYGADVNGIDSLNGWTSIFYAALEGHVNTAKTLVEFGANLQYIDDNGHNVVYFCILEGQIDVLNELLKYYEGPNVSQVTLPSLKSTLNKEAEVESENSRSVLSNEYMVDDESKNGQGKNNDLIPDLQLPPPVLSFRKYGHNFLERKVLVELQFENLESIKLLDYAADMNPGRIALIPNLPDLVTRNVFLPLEKDVKGMSTSIFQVDLAFFEWFKVDFEIFPRFGTRLIAKTTSVSSTSEKVSYDFNTVRLPLFDLRLRNIGELSFRYQVIYPFSGNLLETTDFDIYWTSSTNLKPKQQNSLSSSGVTPKDFLSPKPTNRLKSGVFKNTLNAPRHVENNLNFHPFFVTATSLSDLYLRVRIVLLNDGTPVVCPHWSISITEDIELFLPNLSLDLLTSITHSLFDYQKVVEDLSKMTLADMSYIQKLLRIIYMPLNMFSSILDPEINLSFELLFPTMSEVSNLSLFGNIPLKLNTFIDTTLNDIFNHIRARKLKHPASQTRSIIFMSSNPFICKVLNWKQPNYAVFLSMDGIFYDPSHKAFITRSANGLIINYGGRESTANYVEKNYVDREIVIRSIKEAVNFSLNNNLIGIIVSMYILKLAPELISLIRSRGLVLVTSCDDTNEDEELKLKRELRSYSRSEINGLRFDDSLVFRDDIGI